MYAGRPQPRLRRRRRRTEPGVERERNPRKIGNNGSRSEGAAVVRLKEYALTMASNPAVALLKLAKAGSGAWAGFWRTVARMQKNAHQPWIELEEQIRNEPMK